MAYGLPGYNVTPLNYTGKDGILFHLKDDMSVFLSLTATTDMAYSSPMQVTTQPVQTGQTVTDNVQEQPQTIQIEGVVVVGYEGIFTLTRQTTVVEDFVSTLNRWRRQRQVMRVICKDGITLDNAICTGFEAKKDASIANGLKVSLTFQDANFVVQLGRTQSVQTNANGSPDGAKTKKGAATSKKDVGKSGTQKTIPRTNCEIVRERYNTGTDKATWLEGAYRGCQRGMSYDVKTNKYQWNEKEGAKYIPDSIKKASGTNVNKSP